MTPTFMIKFLIAVVQLYLLTYKFKKILLFDFKKNVKNKIIECYLFSVVYAVHGDIVSGPKKQETIGNLGYLGGMFWGYLDDIWGYLGTFWRAFGHVLEGF